MFCLGMCRFPASRTTVWPQGQHKRGWGHGIFMALRYWGGVKQLVDLSLAMKIEEHGVFNCGDRGHVHGAFMAWRARGAMLHRWLQAQFCLSWVLKIDVHCKLGVRKKGTLQGKRQKHVKVVSHSYTVQVAKYTFNCIGCCIKRLSKEPWNGKL